jgi:hypothetical protein
MKCPACSTEYVAGDRFCGTCGERLPQDGVPAAAPAAIADFDVRQAPVPSAAAPACPVCGAALGADAARCEVCGFEPGASVMMPGAQAAPRSTPLAAETSARVCPIHGPLDPSWTRCPYCLREGREGRLASGPIGSVKLGQSAAQVAAPQSALVPPAASQTAPPEQAAMAPRVESQPEPLPPTPPRMEPPEAIVPAAPQPAAQPPPPPPAAGPARSGPGSSNDLPRSSVGATFAIRRRPRVLAYLIEREGEEVGRVHQLEDDVTDIGRDPRNHIVLTDVLVSGFHARVERAPDGGFFVQDRKSTNGTFVNEEQLSGMRPLDENDALRLGNTTLILKMVG